jgi:hypothetical protein
MKYAVLIRIELFAVFLFMAFVSLFSPRMGSLFMRDVGEGSRLRAVRAAAAKVGDTL